MNVYAIGALGLFVLGIICFFILARRRAYRDPSAAQNYERIRNKLTLREYKEPKKTQTTTYSGGGLGSIMSGFITIVVGCSLLPEIQNQVGMAAGNVSMASGTALAMTGWIFGAGIVIAALSMIYNGLVGLGLLGSPIESLQKAGLV